MCESTLGGEDVAGDTAVAGLFGRPLPLLPVLPKDCLRSDGNFCELHGLEDDSDVRSLIDSLSGS